MKKIVSIAALAALLLAAPSAQATIHDIPPDPFPFALTFFLVAWSNDANLAIGVMIGSAFHSSSESEFVLLPARVGGWIGIVPGAIIGFVPGVVTLHPSRGVATGTLIGCGAIAVVTCAPFYILKKTFYDGPQHLFKRNPPKEDEGKIQQGSRKPNKTLEPL